MSTVDGLWQGFCNSVNERWPAAEADPAALRYYADLPAFLRECIAWREGEGPTPYQLEVAGHLCDPQGRRRVSLRGPHGLGKTGFAAWVVLWFALTSEAAGIDWKVPTTASAWRQLTYYLWPEIRKWASRVRWDRVGRAPFSRDELLQLNLKLPHGEAMAVASDNAAFIEGAHASRILFLFDEAKAIPADTFDAAEGALSTGEAYALAISTPGEPQGRFYEIQARRPGYEDWCVRHVTLRECIEAGRVSEEWAAQRLRQWGEGSPVYANRVLGEFAATDEDSVIPLSWVEAANERWQEWQEQGAGRGELRRIGVDVGHTGDPSVIAPVYNWNGRRMVGTLEHVPKGDPRTSTMELTGRVAARLAALPDVTGVIDAAGIGLGSYQRLFEQRARIVAFVGAERADGKDRSGELGFVSKRAAAWWTGRELLDPTFGADIGLPPDDRLTGDLTAPKYTIESGGRIKVETKEDVIKRLGRSTDYADAVLMALYRFAERPGETPITLPPPDLAYTGNVPTAALEASRQGPLRTGFGSWAVPTAWGEEEDR